MLKKSACLILLLTLTSAAPLYPLFSQSGEGDPPEKKPAGSDYQRVVKIIILENIGPAEVEETLSGISKTWGLFPSLEYLSLSLPGAEKEILILRGYAADVTLAEEITSSLDAAHPASAALFPLPLENLRAPLMKEKLLELSREAGSGWEEKQFLIFPPGPAGSLFFRGAAPDAKKVKVLKDALDQPQYGSFTDSWVNFWRVFRRDAASHFITISTYFASALILILIHFILIKIPWLGKRYERCFTLVWTKLLDTIKGRDFAFEVIKSITEIAVESAQEYGQDEGGEPVAAGAVPGATSRRERARSIARELLVYRGINPDDPQVERVVDNVINAEILKLKNRKMQEEV